MRKGLYRILLPAIVVGTLISLVAPAAPSSALSGSEFRAGNIIDDGIFFNRNLMDAGQIQAFLNSKVPACDTYGTKVYSGNQTRAQYGASQGYPAPYTCLKDYSQNTPAMQSETALCNYLPGGIKSAAQIISDVSVACGINPQVLLVLLQKEQSLVTDDWPWTNQYNKATGFACPDTAPCDPSYGNFFYQVYSAARQFKKYARDATQFNYRAARNNNIYFHPDLSRCGSSTVYIENQATANLYIYTPYQPNQAALNNLYGTGDSCSAYGNRNFWRLYSDWFGSTQMPRVFKNPDSSTIYVQSAGYKFSIPTISTMQDYGLNPGSTQTLSRSYTDGIPTPPLDTGLSNEIGNLAKTNSSQAVYLISQGARYTITSMEQFYSYGFKESDIKLLPDSLVLSVPTGGTLNGFISTPSSNVFKVESGIKRIIFDYNTFIAQNPSGYASRVSDEVAARIPSGDPIASRDILVSNTSGWVRLLINNTYYSIPTQDAYNCWGFGKVQSTPLFRVVNDSYISQTNPTRSISCLPARDNSTNSAYILSGTQRIKLPEDLLGYAQNIDTNLASLANNLPYRSYPISPVVKYADQPVIWYIESGALRPIPSMKDLSLLGYSTVNIDVLNYRQLSPVPYGWPKVGVGQVVKSASSSAVYVTTSNTRITIPTSDDFLAYGFSWSDIVTLDNSFLASQYPIEPENLSNIVYNSQRDRVYLMDSIVYCFEFPDELLPSYGLVKSNVKSKQRFPASQLNINWNACAAGSNLIKSPDSATIWRLENGRKYSFSSWQALVDYAKTSTPYITTISQVNVSRY